MPSGVTAHLLVAAAPSIGSEELGNDGVQVGAAAGSLGAMQGFARFRVTGRRSDAAGVRAAPGSVTSLDPGCVKFKSVLGRMLGAFA